jgi:zinc/manganese transport system substrate-binding protein
LAHLIETIKHEGVPAVFAEKSHSQRLAKRIAEETGAKLIGGLHTGSLGEPGGEAGTYLDLMRYNVRTIVEALQ